MSLFVSESEMMYVEDVAVASIIVYITLRNKVKEKRMSKTLVPEKK